MVVYDIIQLVDARGLACPLPTARVATAMLGLHQGEVLELEATDPGATRDVAAWTHRTGHELLETTTDGRVYRFVLRHK